MLISRIKDLTLAGLSRLTGRTARLLPAEARSEDRILAVKAPYRLEAPRVDLEILHPGPGRLDLEILGYERHFPTRRLWSAQGLAYPGPCTLSIDLRSGAVSLAGQPAGTVPPPIPSRRFCCRLVLQDGRERRTRITGHYRIVGEAAAGIDRGYFEGENYFDHESQSAGEAGLILHWLRRFGAAGPVLEIGCATGNALVALGEAGFPAYGVDVSQWAVERARERLGEDRAWVSNVETEPIHPEVRAHGPYGTLILWSVFEHFTDPFATLEKLGSVTAPGALLLIQTTNADSLSHGLFGKEWEGYFDWTHLGVDRVSARSLQEGLPRLGWRIEHLHTHLMWTLSADPTHATLREWYAADARFRQLLAERNLGDLVLVVARREPAGGNP